MKVLFFEKNSRDKYKYCVIVVKKDDKLILVKHKKRETYEIPGGHIEEGESLLACATRELKEETGASRFEIKHICDYGVEKDNIITCGGLFYANVSEFGPLPDFEIESIKEFSSLPEDSLLTYPMIQPQLLKRVEDENL